MAESMNKISDAQKAAQKRYDKEKTKTLSVKYTPLDMDDYVQLREYLEQTGESVNGLVKELIHTFLTSKDKDEVAYHGIKDRSASKTNEPHIYYPYKKVKKENLEYIYKKIGRPDTDLFLEQYLRRIEKLAVDDFGDSFNEWLENRIIKIVINGNNIESRERKAHEMLRLLNIKFPIK